MRTRPNLRLLYLLPIPLVFLYFFPPDRYPLIPCPFRAATGLLCPGCGATHAIAALTHLHLAQAWQANPLILLLLPALILYLIRPYPIRPPAIAALLAAALTFAIARNL